MPNFRQGFWAIWGRGKPLCLFLEQPEGTAMPEFVRFAAAIVATIALVGTADACSRQTVAGADTLIQPDRKINQGLIDSTIRAELNYHRCKAGLSQLAGAGRLAEVAQTHSRWMARAGAVSHKSTVAGQSTLKARLLGTGIKLKTGSENIGMVHRYGIDGMQFRITGACGFATQGGQTIGAHTYGSLARRMVDLWMASPSHRANILDPKVRMVGSGAGFRPDAPYCGQFYLSQNFAG